MDLFAGFFFGKVKETTQVEVYKNRWNGFGVFVGGGSVLGGSVFFVFFGEFFWFLGVDFLLGSSLFIGNFSGNL